MTAALTPEVDALPLLGMEDDCTAHNTRGLPLRTAIAVQCKERQAGWGGDGRVCVCVCVCVCVSVHA